MRDIQEIVSTNTQLVQDGHCAPGSLYGTEQVKPVLYSVVSKEGAVLATGLTIAQLSSYRSVQENVNFQQELPL